MKKSLDVLLFMDLQIHNFQFLEPNLREYRGKPVFDCGFAGHSVPIDCAYCLSQLNAFQSQYNFLPILLISF